MYNTFPSSVMLNIMISQQIWDPYLSLFVPLDISVRTALPTPPLDLLCFTINKNIAKVNSKSLIGSKGEPHPKLVLQHISNGKMLRVVERSPCSIWWAVL